MTDPYTQAAQGLLSIWIDSIQERIYYSDDIGVSRVINSILRASKNELTDCLLDHATDLVLNGGLQEHDKYKMGLWIESVIDEQFNDNAPDEYMNGFFILMLAIKEGQGGIDKWISSKYSTCQTLDYFRRQGYILYDEDLD